MYHSKKSANTYRLFAALMVVCLFGIVLHWISQIDERLDDYQNTSQMEFIGLRRSQPGDVLHHPKFPPVVASDALDVDNGPQKSTEGAEENHSDTEMIPIRTRKRTPRRIRKREVREREPLSIAQDTESSAPTATRSPTSLPNNEKRPSDWKISVNASLKPSNNHSNDSVHLTTAVLVEGKNDYSEGRHLLHSWDTLSSYLEQLFIPRNVQIRNAESIQIDVLEDSENKSGSVMKSLSLIQESNKELNTEDGTEKDPTERSRTGRIFNWFGFSGRTANVTANSTQLETKLTNIEESSEFTTSMASTTVKSDCSLECNIEYDLGKNATTLKKTCKCKEKLFRDTSGSLVPTEVSESKTEFLLLLTNNCSVVANATIGGCNSNSTDTNISVDHNHIDFEIAQYCLGQLLSSGDLAERLAEISGSGDAPLDEKSARANLNFEATLGQDVENQTQEVFFRIVNEIKQLRTELAENSKSQSSNRGLSSQIGQEGNLTRSPKFIPLRFFDFFGSGSSPRMVDDIFNETILFDGKAAISTVNASKNSSDSLPTDAQCFSLIREILSGQGQITMPNLYDLILYLSKESGKSEDSVSQRSSSFKTPEDKVSDIPVAWDSNGTSIDNLQATGSQIKEFSKDQSFVDIDDLPEPCKQALRASDQNILFRTQDNSDSEFGPRFFLTPVSGSGDGGLRDREPRFFLPPLFGSGDGRNSAKDPLFFLRPILGSGDGRMSNMDSRFFVNFGSGNGRNLGMEPRFFLRPILGSGDSRSVPDPCEGVQLVNGRLFGTLFGSGDGRSIPEVDALTTLTPANNNSRRRGSRLHDAPDEMFVGGSGSTSSTAVPRTVYCRYTKECSTELNERCISYGHTTDYVCGCGKSYVRSPVTRKCQAKVILEASLRFPDETYDEALKDSTSEAFKTRRKSAEQMMWRLIRSNSYLSRSVIGAVVTGFSRGSVVVAWNMMLAAPESETLLDISGSLENNLMRSLRQIQTSVGAPLSGRRISVIGVTRAINPCDHDDLNFCDRNADCHRDDLRAGGFLCSCKENFVDLSEGSGEVCRAVCPTNFCGENGVCKINSNESPECLCSGWYFGRRCAISGIVVVISAAVVNLLIAVASICCCCCIRKRKRRGGYGDRHTQFLRAQDIGLYTLGSHEMEQPVVVQQGDSFYPPGRYTKAISPAELPQVPRPPEINIVPPSYSDSTFYSNSTSPESRAAPSYVERPRGPT